MKTKNSVYIASSLDGYIADKNGGLEWLDIIPFPEDLDMGYNSFTANIDALVMGRTSFETVCAFDIEWPYKKPVFVLSNNLTKIPEELEGKVHLVKGTLTEVLEQIHQQGFHHLYIDGGKTIQSFLREDLIDDMIITIIPVLLGSGIPLFGELSNQLLFECIESKVFIEKVVQNHFKRIR